MTGMLAAQRHTAVWSRCTLPSSLRRPPSLACRRNVLRPQPGVSLPNGRIGMRHTSSGQENPSRWRMEPRETVAKSMAVIYACCALSTGVFALWQLRPLVKARNQALGQADRPTPRTDRLAAFLAANFVLPAAAWRERPWTLLSSEFSHAHFVHYLFNTYSLYFMGSCVAYYTTPGKMLALALGSGLSGTAAWLWQNDGRSGKGALGMSGIVQGVGAATALSFPFMPIRVMAVVPLQMWMYVAGYVAFDTFYLSDETSRTGHAAHLGGVAFGVAFWLLRIRRGYYGFYVR